ncbi:hypothetical protein R9X44_03490 [Actinocorallia sp. A-T 12471]|nr:hypothetical protein [Actinocorallia sp. A-T 12471]MDX6738817.1 hypothetical protein [Actinocorallia sp. A-T 12471]
MNRRWSSLTRSAGVVVVRLQHSRSRHEASIAVVSFRPKRLPAAFTPVALPARTNERSAASLSDSRSMILRSSRSADDRASPAFWRRSSSVMAMSSLATLAVTNSSPDRNA